MANFVLIKHRRHKQAVAQEILQIDMPYIPIFRIFHQKRPQHRHGIRMRLMSRGIQIRQQTVSDIIACPENRFRLRSEVPRLPRRLPMTSAQRAKQSKLTTPHIFFRLRRTLVTVMVGIVETAHIKPQNGTPLMAMLRPPRRMEAWLFRWVEESPAQAAGIV